MPEDENLEGTKSKSPFYPGQPVPVEFFVGRAVQIDRIMTRGAGQVAQGKPAAIFVQGEYGIGKSSIASFVQWIGEKKTGLLQIYVSVGGVKDLEGLAAAILEAVVRARVFNPKGSEKILEWLGKYVGKQDLFGFGINLEQLKRDAPSISTPFALLGFLSEALRRLRDTGIRGIFLVLDEINGITSNPQFAHFIKGLVEANSISGDPLPLLLMLCGVEERRREMIHNHQPIDRIFDVIEIEPLNQTEMEQFFSRAFASVGMTIKADALQLLTHYSAGFPKIMHLLGDAAYWLDKDAIVDGKDAFSAVLVAADEVGKKYVDQQVYRALRSADYRSILDKIGKEGPDRMSFIKSDVVAGLTESEKRKFNNFLQKMKKLKVLRSGDVQGEYIFNLRMVRFYIWLEGLEREANR